MHPTLRKMLYLALIFFVIFVALQPYNYFCNYSNKCQGIYLSELFPSPEGETQISAIMEIKNLRNDIIFETEEPKIIYTVSGKKNIANYRIENNSDKTIRFRPEFYVEPKEFKKYVIRRECLCFREYKLRRGEVILVHSSFKIDPAIEKDPIFIRDKPNIRIGYLAKKTD
ncbi:MAG: hypothetical protein EBS06_05120 [Proteobacteria bacterium]|nr:hypothetical protein [Pseudomonadota bacterium]